MTGLLAHFHCSQYMYTLGLWLWILFLNIISNILNIYSLSVYVVMAVQLDFSHAAVMGTGVLMHNEPKVAMDQHFEIYFSNMESIKA